MHHFEISPNVKMVKLQNPEQKVILVFGHDTKENAFRMMCKLIDVRNTVVTFLRKVKIPVQDIKVSVGLSSNSEPAEQLNEGKTNNFYQ